MHRRALPLPSPHPFPKASQRLSRPSRPTGIRLFFPPPPRPPRVAPAVCASGRAA